MVVQVDWSRWRLPPFQVNDAPVVGFFPWLEWVRAEFYPNLTTERLLDLATRATLIQLARLRAGERK